MEIPIFLRPGLNVLGFFENLPLMSVSLICFSANRDDDGFDLIQPSLIQQLRSILDQYPDDGQILKVKHITFI